MMKDHDHYKSPQELLDELGIARSDEIDLEAIAQHCKATIVSEPLTGCEARILGRNDRAIITVNSGSSLQRQRFSGAHELGHWMHDRGQVGLSCTERMLAGEWGRQDNPERRANRYAAGLLLPAQMFARDARGLPITFATAQRLATKYRTSLSATAIRLVEHGSFPSLVVCSKRDSRFLWFRRSPDIPAKLWPLDRPTGDSIASGLLQEPRPGPFEGAVPIAAWLDVPHDGRNWMHESSLCVSVDLVISLLWWEDEEQLISIVDALERG